MKRKTRRTLEPDGRAGGDSGGLGLGGGVGEVELGAAELGVGDGGHWAVRVVVVGHADVNPVSSVGTSHLEGGEGVYELYQRLAHAMSDHQTYSAQELGQREPRGRGRARTWWSRREGKPELRRNERDWPLVSLI